MNGPSFKIVMDAAVLTGEFRRGLLAAGILALFAVICWAVQEWGVRKSVNALGWFGIFCLTFVGLGAAALIWVGLI